MVATRKKNGKDIRICIDPRDLNTALRRPHHPMKTIEQVTANMAGAKVFSTLDAKNSFWQVPLAEEPQLLSCFNTPFGRFKFRLMPYGLNSGSKVFQQAMEQAFSGTPCEIIVDDIIVLGATTKQHDERLEQVLKCTEETNLKLNPKKCKIRVDQVTYIGHVLSGEGIRPDPEKMKAITEYPAPQNKQELQRCLGVINYISKLIQNFSDNTVTLRESEERKQLDMDRTSWGLIQEAKERNQQPPSTEILWSNEACNTDLWCIKSRTRCSVPTRRSSHSIFIQSTDTDRAKLCSNRKRASSCGVHL